MYKVYAEGIIEVITGPMFSGKSEELIKRVKILGYGSVRTLVIKPSIDKRWEEKKIITRAGASIDAKTASSSAEVYQMVKDGEYDAVAFDEIQFLDEGIVEVVQKLARKGKRVIISGLDQDFKGQPFGVMPQLLAIADIVDKQQAVCMVCHKAATMSFRKTKSQEEVVLGDTESYEARCRVCHSKGEKEKKQEIKTEA